MLTIMQVYEDVDPTTNTTTTAVRVTWLRKDPDYTIYYNNWTRLIVIGIAPVILLMYFNYKVILYFSSVCYEYKAKPFAF